MRVLILICLLAALGCTKKEAEPSADTEAAEAASSEAQPEAAAEASTGSGTGPLADPTIDGSSFPAELRRETPAVGQPPQIQVLTPGADPRKPLKLELAPGSEQTSKLDLGMTVNAVVGVLAMGNPEYVASFEVVTRAGEPDSEGRIPITVTAKSVELDLTAVSDMRQRKLFERGRSVVRKLEGSYLVDPHGHLTKLQMSIPDRTSKVASDMADSLASAIAMTTPVFPAEPLGVGAKWTAHEGIEQAGVLVNQLRTFELTASTDDTIELKVLVQQTAAAQPYESQGQEYRLETFVGEGDGVMTLANGRHLAPTAKTQLAVVTGLRQDKNGQAVGLAVQTQRTVDAPERATTK